MKRIHKQIIYTIIASALILLIVFASVLDYPEEDTTEEVDCYDKNSNKIIGVECTEEIAGLSKEGKILFLSFISPFCIILNFTMSFALFLVEDDF